MTNCPNCGAPLNGTGKCDYCGAVLKKPEPELAVAPGRDAFLLVGDQKYKVYIEQMELSSEYEYVGRGIDGTMYRSEPTTYARFTCLGRV